MVRICEYFIFSDLKIHIVNAFNRKITFNISFRSHCTNTESHQGSTHLQWDAILNPLTRR